MAQYPMVLFCTRVWSTCWSTIKCLMWKCQKELKYTHCFSLKRLLISFMAMRHDFADFLKFRQKPPSARPPTTSQTWDCTSMLRQTDWGTHATHSQQRAAMNVVKTDTSPTENLSKVHVFERVALYGWTKILSHNYTVSPKTCQLIFCSKSNEYK